MKTLHLKNCILLVGALTYLNSCTSFHTPISREINSSDEGYQDSQIRGPSADESTRANELDFDWPVDSAKLTRGYLPKKRRPHWGIDLAAPRGTPILASQTGHVVYTGKDFRGYGKMVLIENGFGWATLYAHLDKILVSEGQKVLPGELIAQMGRTGRASGFHLHFEIRKDKAPKDPIPLLPLGEKMSGQQAAVDSLETEDI